MDEYLLNREPLYGKIYTKMSKPKCHTHSMEHFQSTTQEDEIDFKDFYKVQKILDGMHKPLRPYDQLKSDEGGNDDMSDDVDLLSEDDNYIANSSDELDELTHKSTDHWSSGKPSNKKYSLQELEDSLANKYGAENHQKRDPPHTTLSKPTLNTYSTRRSDEMVSAEEKPPAKSITAPSDDIQAYFIVDTNILIHDLEKLDQLKCIGDMVLKYHIVVPSVVLKEIDYNKKYSNEKSVQVASKLANDWIYKSFSEQNQIVEGQKADQVVMLKTEMHVATTNDDVVLDCCLYFQQLCRDTPTVVALLSNDTNLCNKSLAEGIETINFLKTPEITAYDIMSKISKKHTLNVLQILSNSIKTDIVTLLNTFAQTYFPFKENFNTLVSFTRYVVQHWSVSEGYSQELFKNDPALSEFQNWESDIYKLSSQPPQDKNDIVMMCQIWSRILFCISTFFQADQSQINHFLKLWNFKINSLHL